MFREGLCRLLESEPDLEIAGNCATVDEATAILSRKPVDIVLLDYDLDKERGSQFISRSRQTGYRGRILMVTAGIAAAEAAHALEMGVGGIFRKHSSPVQLAQAIRKVMSGETWLDEHSIQMLVGVASSRKQTSGSGNSFTERENQVLRGVFEGLSNKEIGVRLEISESSVKAALQQLFQKTGVRTRSQLVRIVLEEHRGEW